MELTRKRKLNGKSHRHIHWSNSCLVKYVSPLIDIAGRQGKEVGNILENAKNTR